MHLLKWWYHRDIILVAIRLAVLFMKQLRQQEYNNNKVGRTACLRLESDESKSKME